MNEHTLKVFVASPDRGLLRQLSLTLEEFGYAVATSSSLAVSIQAAQVLDLDFLIVDEDILAGNCRQLHELTQRPDGRPIHTLLLTGNASASDIEAAFELGCGDFLKKPINRGELLARMRSGARFREFRRRAARHASHDSLTGLRTGQSLAARLQRELDRGGDGSGVILLELDFLERINAHFGDALGNEVLRAVAVLIKENGTQPLAARIGSNRFALLRPDSQLDQTMQWAARLREAIAELDLSHLETNLAITASCGVAAGSGESDTAETLLENAQRALADAKRSGGDCVAAAGQFDEEHAAWRDLVESGNPFHSTVARDVMTPFTLTIGQGASVAEALALFEQSQLEWLPVLDEQSNLAGMLDHARARTASNDPSRLVEQLMTTDVPRLSESAPFASVMERFVRDGEPLLVIARGQQPKGYVARMQFLALVRPVTADIFAAAPEGTGAGQSLVVPDLVSADG